MWGRKPKDESGTSHKMESVNNLEVKVPSSALYTIYDRRAEALVGGLQMYKHDAPAIRFFNDVATMEGSLVKLHPHDFDLIMVGFVCDDGTLLPDRKVVLTGERWAEMQRQAQEEVTE